MQDRLVVAVMDLETLLASSCRRRILRVLSSNGRANVMELVRKVNSTYNQVNSNLQILRNEGIIFDEHFGRMRVIRLNKENPRTTLLLQALKILETSEDMQPSKNRKPQLGKTVSEKERKSPQNDKLHRRKM
jgi:predicted transcriptional regulator